MNSLLLQHLVEGKVMSIFNSYGSLWFWLVTEPVTCASKFNLLVTVGNFQHIISGTPRTEVGPFVLIQSDIK